MIYDNAGGIINRIDREKPMMIILHYTVLDYNQTVKMFSNNVPIDGVLAHYLISENGENSQERSPMRFATDYATVGHAGVSYWNGYTRVNKYSIGIENVNKGFTDTDEGNGIKVPGSNKFFYRFTESLIKTLIELCKLLISKHNINSFYITGHADVAVANGRKTDPGPLFPWKRLADNGIGLWYNLNLNYPKSIHKRLVSTKDDFIASLLDYGYPSPSLAYNGTDYITINDINEINRRIPMLLEIYNMHFRPEKGISSNIDSKDFKIIESLLYFKKLSFSHKRKFIDWESLYAAKDSN